MTKRKTRPVEEEPSGGIIPREKIDEVVQDVIAMEAFCAAFREQLQHRLEKGEVFETASLEPKRAMPKWLDPEKAEKAIAKTRLFPRDVYAPRKVMPPGAFCKEAKVGKKDKPPKAVQTVLDLIERKSSGFNLVLRAK